jgi:pimeloyl-ACP methyl ester carboxylesterase
VQVCNSAGCVFENSVPGGDSVTFEATNVPASGVPCGPDIGIYQVLAMGLSGDPDDDGPVYAYGSADLCYEGPAPTYTISGQVTNPNGKPVQGITITAANSTAPSTSAVTDANGQYSFTGLAACSTVTLSATFGSPYTIPITPNDPANGYFYCIQANQTQNFTTANFTAVYLLHGIGQSSLAMQQLAANLTASGGLNLSQFFVDAGFDFSECAASQACSLVTETPTLAAAATALNLNPLACSVSSGSMKLADYVNFHYASIPNEAPYLPATGASGIVLVGYSMGGLIARSLLVNGYSAAYEGVLSNYAVRGLVTLATPNWGYPYIPLDTSVQCPQIDVDMAGSWNTLTGLANPLSIPPSFPLPTFLSTLDASWSASSFGSYWLAAAGRFCNVQQRNQNAASNAYDNPPTFQPILYYTGCIEPNGVSSNDGVVCADSAEYSYSSNPGPTGKPTAVFDDPTDKYSHTNSFLGFGTYLMMGCQASPSQYQQLYTPLPGANSLFSQIVTVINNGH